jgi:hypothetical protein
LKTTLRLKAVRQNELEIDVKFDTDDNTKSVAHGASLAEAAPTDKLQPPCADAASYALRVSLFVSVISIKKQQLSEVGTLHVQHGLLLQQLYTRCSSSSTAMC